MMGRSHCVTSALAWIAVGPLLHLGVPELAAGIVVAGGAGVLPDLDHPLASPARSFGPVSQVVANGVHKVAGGHRQRTHTLVATIAVGGAVWGLGYADRWAALVLIFVLAAFALRLLGPRSARGSVVVSAVMAAVVAYIIGRFVPTGPWLPAAVVIGYAAHLTVDCLSPGGVPLFWPVSVVRVALPVAPVDGLAEHGITAAAGIGFLWLCWAAFSPTVARLV
jgi:membrane-bound metal-dependent hydrolase YbcI (DUF457 family)